jgi:hypothetical protein
MATVLRIVNAADSPESTETLWDLDLPAGTGNPGSVGSPLLSDIDLGSLEPERELFSSPSSPGAEVVYRWHPPVEMGFKVRLTAHVF